MRGERWSVKLRGNVCVSRRSAGRISMAWQAHPWGGPWGLTLGNDGLHGLVRGSPGRGLEEEDRWDRKREQHQTGQKGDLGHPSRFNSITPKLPEWQNAIRKRRNGVSIYALFYTLLQTVWATPAGSPNWLSWIECKNGPSFPPFPIIMGFLHSFHQELEYIFCFPWMQIGLWLALASERGGSIWTKASRCFVLFCSLTWAPASTTRTGQANQLEDDPPYGTGSHFLSWDHPRPPSLQPARRCMHKPSWAWAGRLWVCKQ